MLKQFLKRLVCMHPSWTDNPMESKGDRLSRKRAGYQDWRTGENYWECRKCGKVKNLGYGPSGPNLPINLE